MMDTTLPIGSPISGPFPINQPMNGTLSLAEDPEEHAIVWSPAFFRDAFLDEPWSPFELASDPVQEVAQEGPTTGASSSPRQTDRRKRKRTAEQQSEQQKLGNKRKCSSQRFQTQSLKFKLSVPSKKSSCQRLKRGSACIRCRFLKKPCNGEIPCHQCRNLSSEARPVWKQPCIQATFPDINYFDIVLELFSLYDFMQLLTNQNRKYQNLLPITPDVLKEADGWTFNSIQIHDLFAEQGDRQDIKFGKQSQILLSAVEVTWCMLGVILLQERAPKKIKTISLTREVFTNSDVLMDVCHYQAKFGGLFFRNIQKTIESFRKNHLSIAAGLLLVWLIMIFSTAVVLVYEPMILLLTKYNLDAAVLRRLNAGKYTFRICQAYLSILGERLAEPLRKLKSEPKAAPFLHLLAKSGQFTEKFGGEIAQPCPGFVETAGLEDYLWATSDEEETSDDEEIPYFEATLHDSEEGGVDEGHTGPTAEREIESEDHVGGQFFVEDSDDYFLDPIFSASGFLDASMLPPIE